MVTNAIERLRDKEIGKQFVKGPPKPGEKSGRASCRHCDYSRSWNTTLLRAHLMECAAYREWLRNNPPEELPRSQTIGSHQDDQRRQTTLDFRGKLSSVNVRELDELFGMAVYTSCSSFNTYQSEEWRAFFGKLGYKPPERHTLADSLLKRCHSKVKAEVEQVLKASPYLGLVADESSNIAGDRIENVSVICKGTAYHWASTNLEDRDATADSAVKSLKEAVQEITQGQLERISSLSTDTCSTQRAVWKRIHELEEFKHILTIPCDAHGLQLIIKDLLDPGKDEENRIIDTELRQFYKSFTSIISHFSKAPKQYGILRKRQMRILKKHIALAAAGITRWGTQVCILILSTSIY